MDATSEEALLSAGIMKAKGIATALRSDANNVFITLTAKGLRPDIYILARASHENNEDKLSRAGASRVVSPHLIGGKRMAQVLKRPTVVDFIDIATMGSSLGLMMEEAKVGNGSNLTGKNIVDSQLRKDFGVIIVAIKKMAGNMNPTIRCVEPTACPTLTKGQYRYDFGDTAGLTPLMKMHTLGHSFIPEPIHAGGLRYHGMAPLVSHVYQLGLVEAIAVPQTECFESALQFARSEGIVPAPEPTHAIAAAIREALACRESGEEKTILTAMCGHGHLDLAAYDKFMHEGMVDLELSDEVIEAAMKDVPVLA